MLAQDVRVDPKRDSRVGMAKTSCHDMHWHSRKEQRRRVKVTEIVQAGVRERLC